jgi:hypothetical protein
MKPAALWPVLVGAAGLAAYLRTLAPDLLYGDSAEFQALTYTLGLAHSTGYPLYLLLGRLVGSLPLGTPAWRINLFSALCAALTLSLLYLLALRLTRSHTAWHSQLSAALSCLALGCSYTFWSQAVVAEVYTPGLAFAALVTWLLWRWGQAPARRSQTLCWAALVCALGIGVHAMVGLLAPAAVVYVLQTLWRAARQGPRLSRLLNLLAGPARRLGALFQPDEAHQLTRRRQPSRPPGAAEPPAPPFCNWPRQLLVAAAGTLLGAALLLLAYLALDRVNSPTSFINVALYPSRVFWSLSSADLDTPLERTWLTISGLQWRSMMFPPGNQVLGEQLPAFISRTWFEFSPLMGLLSLLGLWVTLKTRPRHGLFLLLASLGFVGFALNYPVGDQFIFFLPNHLLVALALAPGAGFLLDRIDPAPWPGRPRSERRSAAAPLAAALLLALVVWPNGAARWQALRTGQAGFILEDYHYPLKNPGEPRLLASTRLLGLPEGASLALDWRGLYTTLYLAWVERGRTDLRFYEAMPFGNDGGMAPSLIDQLTQDLEAGRQVFADQVYPGLRQHFRVLPFGSSDLFKVSLRK